MKIRSSQLVPAAKGFTLVEMLLVLSILALLSGIIYPKIIHHKVTANIQSTKVQLKAIEQAIQLYELDNGSAPKGIGGLNVLVVRPANAPNWHQYMEQLPKDAWGNDFVYVYPGKHRPESFDLSSPGEDGQLGTADDINNWPAPTSQASAK